jgi:hypothetical protein
MDSITLKFLVEAGFQCVQVGSVFTLTVKRVELLEQLHITPAEAIALSDPDKLRNLLKIGEN